MARARNIKPGFFTNDELAECAPVARLLFVGLWCLADREGRLENRPKKIKAELFPYDDVDASVYISELVEHGFLVEYEVDGKKYLEVVNFHKHQKPHHMEAPSILPARPGATNKFHHKPVTKDQRDRILERDSRRCTNCGSDKSLHIDHIHPVSKGGTSDDSNLRVLCGSCNTAKGNRDDSSITSRARVDDGSSSTKEQVEQLGSCSTDSLLLIEDSGILNPDSLNPECGNLKPETPSDSESSPAAPVRVDRSSDIREVFAHYRQYHPRFAANPSSRSREWGLIRGRLEEGFTLDQLRRAIDGNHLSPFHCGENERQKTYHGLELIFRNATKVQEFLEVAEHPPPPRLSEKSQRTFSAAESFLNKRSQEDARQHAKKDG